MRMRPLGQTNISVSEIGLGCEHLEGEPYEAVEAVVSRAIQQNMTLFDVFMAEPNVRSHIGRALIGRRQDVILQGHIGSAWKNGQYHRSRDLTDCVAHFQDFMQRLRTDYVDIGMLHFSDSPSDWDQIVRQGILEYALQLKKEGVIRAVGLSSHDPETATLAVKTGMIDVLMFSINPAFDLLPESVSIEDHFASQTYQTSLSGIHPARQALYQACTEQGTAITVMKAYGGSHLLNEQTSPFGREMTPVQCLHYALSRPAVSAVLAGCRTPQEVDAAAEYAQATDKQRDFSEVLRQSKRFSDKRQCLYCNHCLPCPVRIDIAQVLKLADLAEAATHQATLREHYGSLAAKASDCTRCGQCESRCPFAVPVMVKMARAVQLLES